MTAASPLVSVVICTRNRAAALGDTLAALAQTEPPANLPCELVVVDNGSTDGTREVVAGSRLSEARYVVEPTRGVARARNAGLAASRGDVIVFLDDDVRTPARWLEPLCRPILAGAADAVAGGVRIAPHLERPWMEPLHRIWLASTEYLDPRAPQELVSANMAVARHVLAKVPGFDPELGPGALGQGEDSLFAWQLLRAGFRIAPALDVTVEHWFDESRLERAAFADAALRRGRTLAYQKYHWEHVDVAGVRRRRWRKRIALALARLRRGGSGRDGMPVWEMLAIEQLAFVRHWEVESRRPRQYDRFGLVKRTGR